MGMNDKETVALTAGGHRGQSARSNDNCQTGRPRRTELQEQELAGTIPKAKVMRSMLFCQRSGGCWTTYPTNGDIRISIYCSTTTGTQSPGAWQWEPSISKKANLRPHTGCKSYDDRCGYGRNGCNTAKYRALLPGCNVLPCFARAWFKLTL